MENKTRGNGKTKKVVIGVATIVAVAAIAVPTALTLTGGNKDDAGANQGNKYNIVVSCGIDGVSDYSLSVSEGTKISELKSILKGVDGYRIEGIYKDDAMNHPYSDNETISSSTKIYIKFVAVVYTVNIYAEDGTTLVSTQEVNHKDSLALTTPSKAEDDFATYEFKGWFNERNELINLNEITSDLNIHPYFETHMKDYRIGFIYEAFKSSVSVTIGGEPVTLDSTYHYGAKIVIRATQRVGRNITEFKVKVGTGETQDILTEAYRHEENGVVYYEYELDGNGDLSITYNEAASEYSIGQIPTQVTVTRNGHTLSSNEAIYYGDQLTISYTESEGHHKDTFSVDGAEFAGGVWIVKGDLTISYTEAINSYEVKFYSEDKQVLLGSQIINYGSSADASAIEVPTKPAPAGSATRFTGWTDANGNAVNLNNITGNINVYASYETYKIEYHINVPAGVTVRRGEELLSNSSVIYWDDVLTLTYTESSRRDTGNTKQEAGYHYTEVETTIYSLTANGTSLASGRTFTVNGDVTLSLTSSASVAWERGEMVQYSLGIIPSGVTVKRGNETLNSNSVIYWGDVLTFTYTETSVRLTGNTKIESGFKWSEKATTTNILKANVTSLASGRTFTVNGDIALSLSSDTTTAWEKGEVVVHFADASWSEINEVAQAGYAAEVFSVGDEKDITLTDGEVLTVVVLGFNHDNLTSGGKAKMSIGMKHLTKTKAHMNTTGTNAGGWEASAMRTTLNNYYEKLPNDLKSVIKSVNKDASAGEKSTNITTSTDKLWLFSMAELCGQAAINSFTSNTTNQTVYKSQGTQYEYYRNLIGDSKYSDAGLIKKLSNGAGSANAWWLRSPYMDYSILFLSVGNSGSISNNIAVTSNGVCFGYCI